MRGVNGEHKTGFISLTIASRFVLLAAAGWSIQVNVRVCASKKHTALSSLPPCLHATQCNAPIVSRVVWMYMSPSSSCSTSWGVSTSC